MRSLLLPLARVLFGELPAQTAKHKCDPATLRPGERVLRVHQHRQQDGKEFARRRDGRAHERARARDGQENEKLTARAAQRKDQDRP